MPKSSVLTSTPESTLELLREQFPKCFVRHPHPRQPLKIGIHKDACAALAGVVSRRKLHRALMAYTNNPAYREQLKAGAVRIDLSGEPVGVVTPEQVPPPLNQKATHGSHPPAPTAPSPKRLSLADLKTAGAARRTRPTPDRA
jgi:sRNA-binding protein